MGTRSRDFRQPSFRIISYRALIWKRARGRNPLHLKNFLLLRLFIADRISRFNGEPSRVRVGSRRREHRVGLLMPLGSRFGKELRSFTRVTRLRTCWPGVGAPPRASGECVILRVLGGCAGAFPESCNRLRFLLLNCPVFESEKQAAVATRGTILAESRVAFHKYISAHCQVVKREIGG